MRRDEGKKVDIKRLDDICVCSKLPFDNHHSDTTLHSPYFAFVHQSWCEQEVARGGRGGNWKPSSYQLD